MKNQHQQTISTTCLRVGDNYSQCLCDKNIYFFKLALVVKDVDELSLVVFLVLCFFVFFF